MGKSFLSPVGILGLVLLSAGVASADVRSLAVGACIAAGSITPALGWEGMLNPSTTTAMPLDCSLTSNYGSGNPTPYATDPFVSSTGVIAVDHTASAGVSCSMKVINWAGLTTFTGATLVTGTAGIADVYHLDWTPNASGIPYFACSVPLQPGGASTRSGIKNVWVAN